MLALQKPTVRTALPTRTVTSQEDKLTMGAYCLLPCSICKDYTPVSMTAVLKIPLDKLSIICYFCYDSIIQDNLKMEVSNYE